MDHANECVSVRGRIEPLVEGGDLEASCPAAPEKACGKGDPGLPGRQVRRGSRSGWSARRPGRSTGLARKEVELIRSWRYLDPSHGAERHVVEDLRVTYIDIYRRSVRRSVQGVHERVLLHP